MSDAVAEAISDLITETRRAYRFSPGSHTMSAVAAALAVEHAFARDAEPFPVEAAPDWIAEYLDHHEQRVTP